MIALTAPGPYTYLRTHQGHHAILDARGNLIAIVTTELAHHDAPIVCAALNEREAAARLLDQEQLIQDLRDEIEDLEGNLSDAEDRIEELAADLEDAQA